MKELQFIRAGAIGIILCGIAAGLCKVGLLGGLLVLEGAAGALAYGIATEGLQKLRRKARRRKRQCEKCDACPMRQRVLQLIRVRYSDEIEKGEKIYGTKENQ